MHKLEKTRIKNIPEISAIYFALLQCGYEYFSLERSQEHIEKVRSFIDNACDLEFFPDVQQSSCEVYPYWPRAFILEAASFYLNSDGTSFENFQGLQQYILNLTNISSSEKGDALWKWLEGFPAALKNILSDTHFKQYLVWENQWISGLNKKYSEKLQQMNELMDVCICQYHSPVTKIEIVVNPIKCVYSADYYLRGESFIFSSGKFQLESIVHEFLHHVIHPFILQQKDFILEKNTNLADIDRSYYLSGDDTGKLNAFEEYAVRRLTEDVLERNYPDNLLHYLCRIV